MSAEEDDENAYRTSEGMIGRSFRRGIRKGLKAVTFGIFGGGDVTGDALTNLGIDAAKELPEAIRRSRESRDSSDD